MKRRRIIVVMAVLAILGIAALFLWRPVAEKVGRQFLISQLSSRLNATVEIDQFRIALFPPAVDATGLKIKRKEGPLRYIGVNRAYIQPGMGPIFLGRITIKQVKIDHPTLRFELGEMARGKRGERKEGFRLPTLKDLLRIDVEKVSINDASLTLHLPVEDIRVIVDAGKMTFRGKRGSERWSWDGAGEVRRGGKSLRLDRAIIVADRDGEHVTLEKFEARGLGTVVAIRGPVFPDAKLSYSIKTDLDLVDQALNELAVFKKPADLSGEINGSGTLVGPWNQVKGEGQIRLSGFRFRRRSVGRVILSHRTRGSAIESITGEVGFGEGKVMFGTGPIRMGRAGSFTVQSKNLRYEYLQSLINPGRSADLVGPVTVKVEGKIGLKPFSLGGSYQITSPELAMSLPPNAQRYVPLVYRNLAVHGALAWQGKQGFVLEEGKVSGEGFTGSFGFRFAKGRNVTGTWIATVEDVARVFAEPERMGGYGTVGGGLTFHQGDYEAILDIQLEAPRYFGHTLSSANGKIAFQEDITLFEKVRVRKGEGALKLEARSPTLKAENQAMSLEASVVDFDLAVLGAIAARRYTLLQGMKGVGSGSVSLSGHGSDRHGMIAFDVNRVTWRDQEPLDGKVHIDVNRGSFQFQNVHLQGKRTSVRADGAVGVNGYETLRVRWNGLPLSSLGVPAYVSRMVPLADLDLTFGGALVDPSLDGRVEFGGDREASPGNGKLLEGRGTLRGTISKLQWTLNAGKSELHAEGWLNAHDFSDFSGKGVCREFASAHFLPNTEGYLSLDWELQGDLQRRRNLVGSLVLHEFTAKQGEWDLRLAAPTTISIRPGSIQLKDSLLKGKDTTLQLAMSLDADDRFDGYARGEVSLGLLTLFNAGINRTEGTAEVSARMTGTRSLPQVTGQVSVKDGLIQFLRFPHAFEEVQLEASFAQQRVLINRIEAQVADGEINGKGILLLSPVLNESTLDLKTKLTRIQLRYPAWLPTIFSGDVDVIGSVKHPLLRGEVLVHKATYLDDWDWKSRILKFGGTGPAKRAFRKEEQRVLFDIVFRTEGDTFLIDNDLANAALRGEVRLLGSEVATGLTGRVEVRRGEVHFLDNDFELMSGFITFDSEQSIRSTFDVTAKTRVEDIEIFLDIRSENQDVVAFLSSQPPRDETDIVALLTFGVDTQELNTSGGSNEAFSSSVVPTVLTAPVESQLGTGLRKTRLVDTFQFVPFYSEDTKTPGIKMIVGKRVYRKFRLLYSTDLLNVGAENTVQLEQRFNSHVSVQGSVRDDRTETKQELDVGLDIEFRVDF